MWIISKDASIPSLSNSSAKPERWPRKQTFLSMLLSAVTISRRALKHCFHGVWTKFIVMITRNWNFLKSNPTPMYSATSFLKSDHLLSWSAALI